MTENKNNLIPKPPIVVVMGHIDHGKSTLLDYIRKANTTEKEAGGITQHLGAYEVEFESGEKKYKMTFLDTPGHEAFQNIRSRGTKVADIAILVVAADDGVKPQTLEALKCINEEKIPFVVAINKIDKTEANLERTKNNLAENEIFLEGYGGKISSVAISAKTGQGIPELLELIGLIAELEGLTGDPSLPASGVVLESSLDPKKGIVATLVIENGTLNKGAFVVSEKALAPVRIVENFLGEKIEEATFSSPVRIIGWSNMPNVGATFKTFKNKKEAEKMAREFKESSTEQNKFQKKGESDKQTIVPVIVKADTIGSAEAVRHELDKLNTEEVSFKVIDLSVGDVSENDVKKAGANEKTIIIGFNTKSDPRAVNLAERDNVVVKHFDIIYKITEWLKTEFSKHLPKVETETVIGKAKILKIFNKQKDKQIIGGVVLEGEIENNGTFRILRRNENIGIGKVKELQQKKEKVGVVKEKNEFGAMIEAKTEIASGDVLEFYRLAMQEVKI